MSGAGFVLPIPAIIPEITQLIGILAASNRNIGGIIADCTIEEEGTDELATTEHPVEQGANITDHAYKKPATLTIRAGWSNSSFAAAFNPGYAQDIYNQLLALQASANVFTVVTGKRQYDNMLMILLRQATNEESENGLAAVMQFRQIIFGQTQATSVPPQANMAQPQKTAAVQNLGPQQLIPLNLSSAV